MPRPEDVEDCCVEGCGRKAATRPYVSKATGRATWQLSGVGVRRGRGWGYHAAQRDKDGFVVGYLCWMHARRKYRGSPIAREPASTRFPSVSACQDRLERAMLSWADADEDADLSAALEVVVLAANRLRLARDREYSAARRKACKPCDPINSAASTPSDASSPRGGNESA